MSKIFTMLFIVVFLSGCFWQSIYPRHISKGVELCEPNEGLRLIQSYWDGDERYICMNGATFESFSPADLPVKVKK